MSITVIINIGLTQALIPVMAIWRGFIIDDLLPFDLWVTSDFLALWINSVGAAATVGEGSNRPFAGSTVNFGLLDMISCVSVIIINNSRDGRAIIRMQEKIDQQYEVTLEEGRLCGLKVMYMYLR